MPEVTVGGIRLHYEMTGEGEPVVLVCGTGQPAVSWHLSQVPALVGAGYRVVTFDNRGMPPSDEPPPPYTVADMVGDTAGLIEQLDLGPCRVAGTSLGALITQELALARPDLVRAAAMIGTAGRQNAVLRAWTQARVELFERRVRLPQRFEVVTGAFETFSAARLHDDAFFEGYLQVMLSMPPWDGDGARGQFEADRAYDGRLQALRDVAVPCLVIAFEHDMLTSTVLCREVAEAIPGCRYVEIPGSGHAGIVEAADAVNGALAEFFAGV